ncbi:MAG: hypothetical protein KDA27_23310 [Candidatus Eisenbacteria bacterium]|uniref:Uncharacterized protein n=1 Tax=Eiseniibacteriota bacterium TaxID=2212470 RepID=A0A956NH37_UNCEI|nr:hypothetical protein [Candidatus Eisenbacteria bacterium]MCB9465872.1 hypothetical protein [Candidatus Eisenbacteria bacterium]
MNRCVVASTALTLLLAVGCSDGNGPEPPSDLGLAGSGTLTMSGNDTANLGTKIHVGDMAYLDSGDGPTALVFVDRYSRIEGDTLTRVGVHTLSLYPDNRFRLYVGDSVPGVRDAGAVLEIVRSGRGGAYATPMQGEPGRRPEVDLDSHVAVFENVTLYPDFFEEQDTLSPITLNGTITWGPSPE